MCRIVVDRNVQLKPDQCTDTPANSKFAKGSNGNKCMRCGKAQDKHFHAKTFCNSKPYMLRMGATLNQRILAFPTPVVVACSGHGIAMGSFILMCADYRIGVKGAFKIGMNEVAIGMTLPYFAIEIARRRLAPTYFDRATVLAELYAPSDAIAPGFLDRVVAPDDLLATAQGVAETLAKLDMKAHAATKLRSRRATIDAIDHMVDAQFNS